MRATLEWLGGAKRRMRGPQPKVARSERSDERPACSEPTPHPPFGHLLPQGEKAITAPSPHITTIGEPDGTRWYRSITSWFSSRTQPDEIALPIVRSSVAPWIR